MLLVRLKLMWAKKKVHPMKLWNKFLFQQTSSFVCSFMRLTTVIAHIYKKYGKKLQKISEVNQTFFIIMLSHFRHAQLAVSSSGSVFSWLHHDFCYRIRYRASIWNTFRILWMKCHFTFRRENNSICYNRISASLQRQMAVPLSSVFILVCP